MDTEERLLELFQTHGGFLTRQIAFGSGLHSRVLAHWVADGRARRLQRGVYCLQSVNDAESEIIGIHFRIPEAILCLDSSLYYHGLVRHRPEGVSLALCRGTRVPALDDRSVRIVHCSGHLFRLGVGSVWLGGFEIPAYTAERSLVDALRFHGMVPEASIREALGAYLDASGLDAGVQRLAQMAGPCRATSALTAALKQFGVRGDRRMRITATVN